MWQNPNLGKLIVGRIFQNVETSSILQVDIIGFRPGTRVAYVDENGNTVTLTLNGDQVSFSGGSWQEKVSSLFVTNRLDVCKLTVAVSVQNQADELVYIHVYGSDAESPPSIPPTTSPVSVMPTASPGFPVEAGGVLIIAPGPVVDQAQSPESILVVLQVAFDDISGQFIGALQKKNRRLRRGLQSSPDLVDLGEGRYVVVFEGNPTTRERIDSINALFSDGISFHAARGAVGVFPDGVTLTIVTNSLGKCARYIWIAVHKSQVLVDCRR